MIHSNMSAVAAAAQLCTQLSPEYGLLARDTCTPIVSVWPRHLHTCTRICGWRVGIAIRLYIGNIASASYLFRRNFGNVLKYVLSWEKDLSYLLSKLYAIYNILGIIPSAICTAYSIRNMYRSSNLLPNCQTTLTANFHTSLFIQCLYCDQYHYCSPHYIFQPYNFNFSAD